MSDESLFREVDEEVRREQIAKIWKRYGNIFVGLSIAIVIAVAGFKGWQYWQRVQAEQAGKTYFTASNFEQDGNSAKALATFKALSKGAHSGYATLARFRVADILAATGKHDEALKAFDVLAADSSLDKSLRDVARVRAAFLVADSASATELSKRLSGLDAKRGPWRDVVNELIALASYRSGDYADADRRMNEVLASPNLSPGARQRAQIFLQVLQPHIAQSAAKQ